MSDYAKFPTIIVHTTKDAMETRMVRNGDELSALIESIKNNPTTISYEVFESVRLVTKTVEWKQTPKPDEPWT